MSDSDGPPRHRHEDRSVTYKHVVYALPFVAAAAVTFGGFVLSRAQAEGMGALKVAEQVQEELKALKVQVETRDSGQREDVRQLRQDSERRQAVVEQKVDRVDSKVDQVLRELKSQRTDK